MRGDGPSGPFGWPKSAENAENRPNMDENATIGCETPEIANIPHLGLGIGYICSDGEARLMEVSLTTHPPHPEWRVLRVGEDQEC